MEYKNNVFIETYAKRRGGRKYREVRFHVGNTIVQITDLLVASDDAAYEKAKNILRQATEL